jgi:adenylate kinase family enzyme
VQRISIVGNSGSGKTTLGRRLADQLGAPFVELDSLYHQPGWEPLPTEEFQSRVAAVAAEDRWVVDGNYSAVREILWQRADTVIWFDLPRGVVMARVVRRTLRRTLTREELWNGNREPFDNLWRLDPKRNIIRWAWTNHGKYRARYEALAGDERYGGVRFLRVTSREDADALVAAAATETTAS